jgi:uncharacterized metal-binding protein
MSDQNTNINSQQLIFACDGASDVGAIADFAARDMAKQGMGKLFCLVAMGAHIESYIAKARQASELVVVDGCGMDCGRKCLEHLGFSSFKHIRVTDLGMEKGKSLPTKENVQKVTDFARTKLRDNQGDI